MGFLQEKRIAARVLTGAGEGASEVEHEALSQLRQVHDLQREHDRILDELAEVARYETSTDADGNPVAVPINRYQDEARTRREQRLADILLAIVAIKGAEGAKAIDEATKREAAKRRELQSQKADADEVQRRAEAMVREERICTKSAMSACPVLSASAAMNAKPIRSPFLTIMPTANCPTTSTARDGAMSPEKSLPPHFAPTVSKASTR